MDEEGWYSVTPEQIAIRHALRCVVATAKPNPVVIDCFAGVGGNAIQFARMCCSVVAIDIDPERLELAINKCQNLWGPTLYRFHSWGLLPTRPVVEGNC